MFHGSEWAMDESADDLIDLLTYVCPFSGKKRVAGLDNGELSMKCLGSKQTYISRCYMFRFYFYVPLVSTHRIWQSYLINLGSWKLNLQIKKKFWCTKTILIDSVLPSSHHPRPSQLPLSNASWCSIQWHVNHVMFDEIIETRDLLVCCFQHALETSDNLWPSKETTCTLKKLADSFDAETFDWSLTRSHGLFNRCPKEPGSCQQTCGRILSRCKDRVTNFREDIGIRLCVFKLGVTSNPIQRYIHYKKIGFTCMWIIAVSHSIDLIHMLEAALVSEYCKHVGCRNKEGSGGEGALNKKDKAPPPYFMYVTGGRADQNRRVGWKHARTMFLSFLFETLHASFSYKFGTLRKQMRSEKSWEDQSKTCPELGFPFCPIFDPFWV